ncbi:glycosyl hydrolase family 43 [Sphingomonas sp. KR1UV-12]|uniref:Glycosyl hydrolase family 43 n=1 Tax=Sphingomonas aurea TaxID=3063994 RepID=A0ABT9EHP8_9SPHN|nr:glycosyl hydrolase family 43 [Sphingomonas sp. KR1UV-12]MDP1026485.1 glycosyl hydrolase family 43 [Sphingomonas sp. KR1UV-12]
MTRSRPIWSTAAILLALLAPAISAQQRTVPAGAPETPYVAPDKAYLFAHMTKERYGVLHYSVSRDGLHWRQLNRGQPVSSDYHGHPSIARGEDGRYYLVGNRSDDDPLIRFWVSNDLVRWTAFGSYRPELRDIAGLPGALQRIGAPKLFYDPPSRRYLLTWHTPNVPGASDDPERYWTSQRTLYVLSPDLKRFAARPQRLFDWDMATIDTFVVPNDVGTPGYCAVFKDERYPSYDWTTGKTVRISCAPTLTGPYPLPGPPLSPNFREAPTLIRSPDDRDWLLYYEQYAGTSYGLSKAPRLAGPWYQVSGNTGVAEWDRYAMPPGLRHGSMIAISRAQLDALVAAYPPAG